MLTLLEDRVYELDNIDNMLGSTPVILLAPDIQYINKEMLKVLNSRDFVILLLAGEKGLEGMLSIYDNGKIVGYISKEQSRQIFDKFGKTYLQIKFKTQESKLLFQHIFGNNLIKQTIKRRREKNYGKNI